MTRMTRSFDRRLTSDPVQPRTEQARLDRRAVYRDRAPGVGYGNSSGYASARRYASGWTGQDRFRCS